MKKLLSVLAIAAVMTACKGTEAPAATSDSIKKVDSTVKVIDSTVKKVDSTVKVVDSTVKK